MLRAFEKRAQASSHLWLQIITQNKLFHRLAFTLQGIIVNVQAVLWLQKGSEAANILTILRPAVGHDLCPAVFLFTARVVSIYRKKSPPHQRPLKGYPGH